MREGMLKMCSKKIYRGEDEYSFVRTGFRIGKGGTGAVYDVEILEPGRQRIPYPVVVKFFEYDGEDKEKRYDRFKKEVEVVRSLNGIKGIIDIIDKKCPNEVPSEKDDAWYLMPKAEEYKFDRKKSLGEKIEDMISLADTLRQIHKNEYAHRDIKPGNILVLKGKIVLSDFGLVWCVNGERLTEMDERVGPYKIMPPELEHVQADMNLDFRPSDVYLFSKVLWMNLKNDNIGFRGQYKRGDDQIYLDKSMYDVCTLEPIHKLIEESTYEDVNKRIPVEKCIEYLLLQKQIITEPRSLSEEVLRNLQYEEDSKRIVEKNVPDEYVYSDKMVIYEFLRSVISNAVIFVRSSDERIKEQEIKVTNCIMTVEGTYQFLFYFNGKMVNEYLLNVKKMSYIHQEERIELELDDLGDEKINYVLYGEEASLLGGMIFKRYFSSKHIISISKR